MEHSRYVLERFKEAEDYPEATEDVLLDYLSDLINKSATNKDEAYEILVEYLDYLQVDPDSLVIKKKGNRFDVEFAE